MKCISQAIVVYSGRKANSNSPPKKKRIIKIGHKIRSAGVPSLDGGVEGVRDVESLPRGAEGAQAVLLGDQDSLKHIKEYKFVLRDLAVCVFQSAALYLPA